jgi:hypothetical protein
MSRTCQCGGPIKTKPADDGLREWCCTACGRYELLPELRSGPGLALTPAPPLRDEAEHRKVWRA